MRRVFGKYATVFRGEDLSKVCKGAELVNFRISRYEPDF